MNTGTSRHDILSRSRSPGAAEADRIAARVVTVIRVALLVAVVGLLAMAVW